MSLPDLAFDVLKFSRSTKLRMLAQGLDSSNWPAWLAFLLALWRREVSRTQYDIIIIVTSVITRGKSVLLASPHMSLIFVKMLRYHKYIEGKRAYLWAARLFSVRFCLSAMYSATSFLASSACFFLSAVVCASRSSKYFWCSRRYLLQVEIQKFRH